ncbi:MAG: type IV pilin protein [Gammaproteobacteria bacterium]
MRHKTRHNGFTLIEMIVVVGIVSILAAIAYPSYQKRAQKAKRTDAKAALINLAAQQERFFLRNNRYASTLADLGIDGTENEFYEITITSGGNSEFLAEAVPAGSAFSGGQWLDTECLKFGIDQLGRKTAFKNGNTDNADVCWR